MSEITRTQALDNLEQDWGRFVACFRRLPPAEQQAWLAAQGYTRFSDLLGHVIAWWEDGFAVISRRVSGEEVALKEYDVDAFNAQAVERFAAMDEAVVESEFENGRRRWVAFINQAPDAAFADQKIVDRLFVELIGHYQEHAMPGY